MPDPLALQAPTKLFKTAEKNAILSFTRPLTKIDYYEARVHPKDGKHGTDLVYGGIPYVCRHVARSWRSGHKGKAVAQVCLLPMSAITFTANCAFASLPALAIFFGQRLLPLRPRSDAATREDVVGRSIFAFSRVVNAFAATLQHHDLAQQRPVDKQELRELQTSTELTLSVLRHKMEQAEPRVKSSKSLANSLEYLEYMNRQLGRRMIQGP